MHDTHISAYYRRVLVTMPDELYQRLQEQATARMLTVSAYLRLLIQAQLPYDETGDDLRPGRWQQQGKGDES